MLDLDPVPSWCPDQDEVDYPPAPTSRRPRWTDRRAQHLVNAFREHGPNYRRVGKAVGVDQRTAKRAWDRGLAPAAASHFHGLRPVKEVIAEEQAEARVPPGR